MKVRLNKRRLLLNLRHNNYYVWQVAPYVRRSKELQKRNERIKKILDSL